MIYLDYTAINFSIVNGTTNQLLYTTPYKCEISIEFTATTGLPLGGINDDDSGIYYVFGENLGYKHFLTHQVDQGAVSNSSYFRGGTIIVRGGVEIRAKISGGSGTTFGKLHIKRLPESPWYLLKIIEIKNYFAVCTLYY